jgi:hypothetical protein
MLLKQIKNEEILEDLLSEPSTALVEMMSHLNGDIMILGIAGKMGMTLGRMAQRAVEQAGVKKDIIGVARFSDPASREKLESWGIKTIKCDILESESVAKLPKVKNIVYMAGRKFGTDGTEELTWAMNVVAPEKVAEHFTESRITVFSTGCVYPLVPVASGGCTETVLPAPVGEYAQSCLGRERVFGHYAKKNNTPVLLLRLNYAIDLRYGVLYDIASKIWNSEPVNSTVEHFNIIWQGDANDYALRSLEYCASPATVLNITGPETASTVFIAETFGKLMNKEVKFDGTSSDLAYLNNSAKAFKLFGYPRVSLEQMIEWQAHWIMGGGSSLNKPTHFEVNNGKF